MKKFVLVPDSFKGTMTSAQVCASMEAGIRPGAAPGTRWCRCRWPTAERAVPRRFDGLGRTAVVRTVTGPEGRPLESFYALLPDGTAVIEMAAAAGLPQVIGEKNPETTTTYGVGELLVHAAHHGAKRAGDVPGRQQQHCP